MFFPNKIRQTIMCSKSTEKTRSTQGTVCRGQFKERVLLWPEG